MQRAKEDILFLIRKNKRVTKQLILYYQPLIIQGLPYAAILQRIKNEFDFEISYNSFALAVSRHLNKSRKNTKQKPTETPAPEGRSEKSAAVHIPGPKAADDQIAQKKETAEDWGFSQTAKTDRKSRFDDL